MGSFDFIYCDTGEKIRGRNGYIYITKKLQDYCDLPNPIKFVSTDNYGRFDCIIGTLPSSRLTQQIDIYALYAAQLYLENIVNQDEEKIKKYLDILKLKNYDRDAYEFEFKKVEDGIRVLGIDYFYDNYTGVNESNGYITVDVPAIRNRNPRPQSLCFKYFTGKLPLIISKGFIPSELGVDPVGIATNWGFVTGDDPEQGDALGQNFVN